MLKPSKHTDPNQTVLAAAALILDRLHKKRSESFNDLHARLREKIPGSDRLFGLALTLLYALEVVEYHQKTDSFEYRGDNEAP